MFPPEQSRQSTGQGTGVFATTHWSVVVHAGDSRSPEAESAMERLCRTYWYPLYVFVRRKGHNHEDASDLTQAFFKHSCKHLGPSVSWRTGRTLRTVGRRLNCGPRNLRLRSDRLYPPFRYLF